MAGSDSSARMRSLRHLVKIFGGAGVDVVGFFTGGQEVLRFRVAGFVFAEDDADEVVGAGFVVALLHRGGDLVVGLGDDCPPY